jgi:outer membrane protein assembly factor BamB
MLPAKGKALVVSVVLVLSLALGSCRILGAPFSNPDGDYDRQPQHVEVAPSGLVFVATGGGYYQGVVWVLDLSARDKMRPIKELAGKHVGLVLDLVLGPDGNVYALTMEGGIWVIDGATGKPRKFKEGFYRHMAFTPDDTGILLVRGSDESDSTLEVSDGQGNHLRYVQHNLAEIQDIALASNQEAYVVGFKSIYGPKYIEVVDIPNGETVREIELVASTIQGEDVHGLEVAPSGELYLLTGRGLHVVDIAQGQLVATVTITDAASLDMDLDDQIYVVAWTRGDVRDQVYVIDSATYSITNVWRVGLERGYIIEDMIAVQDGKAFLGTSGTVLIFDLETGEISERIRID